MNCNKCILQRSDVNNSRRYVQGSWRGKLNRNYLCSLITFSVNIKLLKSKVYQKEREKEDKMKGKKEIIVFNSVL